MPQALDFTWVTVPGNSESVIPLDSTRGLGSSAASLATGSPFLAPGPYRGRWSGAVVRFTALSTGQNVTVLGRILTGVAGTAADWETQGAAGTMTITAGTTAVHEWKPLAADFQLLVNAGATGPTTLVLKISVLWNGDYGS